jgi:hypothetical protein
MNGCVYGSAGCGPIVTIPAQHAVSSPALAYTGTDVAVFVMVALLLLAFGVSCVLAGRRSAR